MIASMDIPNNDLIGSLELQDPKWETFANEYFKDPNAKQAAMVAGISEVSAGKMGHTWLRNPKIKARIEYLQSQAKKAASITEEDIIEELGLILKSNIQDFALDENGQFTVKADDKGVMDLRKWRAVESVTVTDQANGIRKVTFKLWSKTAALQLAMNWKGMLKGDRSKKGDNDSDNNYKGKDWRKKLAEYIGIPEEDLPS